MVETIGTMLKAARETIQLQKGNCIMEERFFELVSILRELAEAIDDILESIETINGHRIEATWINEEMVGIAIDHKEYGGFTGGEFYIDIDELLEILSLCGETEEEKPKTEKPEFMIILNDHIFNVRLEDYNQCYNVYLEGDEDIDVPQPEIIKENPTGYYMLCKDNLGFTHFGFVAKYRSYDRPAGYMWSSRASVFNEFLPCHITEAYYNRQTVSISIEDLKDIVDFGRYLGYSLAVDLDDSNGEFQYSVVDPTNPEHDIHRIIW